VIISIHQPNFCPWLGYFSKILRSDLFILLDHVEYSKNGWTNRVRIKTPQGPQWLTVPVLRRESHQTILETQTNPSVKWNHKIVKSLEANYGRTPFFREHFPRIETLLGEPTSGLADLNIRLLDQLLDTLGFETSITRSSELNHTGNATDLLVSLVESAGGNTYLSGDGAEYQENQKFEVRGISLETSNFTHPEYQQLWGEFAPGLSVLDALFNVGAEGTRRMLIDELEGKLPTPKTTPEETLV
jgi:hypothetical protein